MRSSPAGEQNTRRDDQRDYHIKLETVPIEAQRSKETQTHYEGNRARDL